MLWRLAIWGAIIRVCAQWLNSALSFRILVCSSCIIVLRWLKTLLNMANTELLFWAAALSKIWTNVIISISSLLLLIATATCQDILLLPNHSDWLSWCLRGRYFSSPSQALKEWTRRWVWSKCHVCIHPDLQTAINDPSSIQYSVWPAT